MTTILESMIHEALAYEADAFECDAEVNGADLVEWFSQWRERAEATLQASQAGAVAALRPAEEEPLRFRNYYEHCGQEWTDDWSAMSDDECPVCHRDIEPYRSEDLLPDEDAGIGESAE